MVQNPASDSTKSKSHPVLPVHQHRTVSQKGRLHIICAVVADLCGARSSAVIRIRYFRFHELTSSLTHALVKKRVDLIVNLLSSYT